MCESTVAPQAARPPGLSERGRDVGGATVDVIEVADAVGPETREPVEATAPGNSPMAENAAIDAGAPHCTEAAPGGITSLVCRVTVAEAQFDIEADRMVSCPELGGCG
mmetsp:Transcript_87352/g.251885  ORF Transcript_87352/g.251885 Transcript_87352/m.251885 type:complete len:108 (+) Transcript_87352:349-672(+)